MAVLTLLQLTWTWDIKAQGKPQRVLNEQQVEESCGQAKDGGQIQGKNSLRGKSSPGSELAGDPVE